MNIDTIFSIFEALAYVTIFVLLFGFVVIILVTFFFKIFLPWWDYQFDQYEKKMKDRKRIWPD